MKAPTTAGLAAYFLRLGAAGFGGPIALTARMHRDLVEARRWVRASDYLDRPAFSRLAPRPPAAQLAMYLGYVQGGVTGATVAGVAFVLPSFLMVLTLSIAYVAYGGLRWVQAAFSGVGPLVIAIIAVSAFRLGSRVVKRDA